MQKLIHELLTHQIELEMQNEELRMGQTELEESRQRYWELYDFAPVGYFTFDKNGLVKEANLTGASMLGMNRQFMMNRPFSVFVEPDYRMVFMTYCDEAFKRGAPQVCEIILRKSDGTRVHAAFP